MTTNSATSKNGRYLNGGVSTVQDGFLKYWDKTTFPTDETDSVYIIDADYEGRPDKLSYSIYGTSDFAWFILQYNNIIDITDEFVVGKELYLPTKNRLLLDLIKNKG